MMVCCVAHADEQSMSGVDDKFAIATVKGLIFVRHENGMCFAVQNPHMSSALLTYVPCLTTVEFVKVK